MLKKFIAFYFVDKAIDILFNSVDKNFGNTSLKSLNSSNFKVGEKFPKLYLDGEGVLFNCEIIFVNRIKTMAEIYFEKAEYNGKVIKKNKMHVYI